MNISYQRPLHLAVISRSLNILKILLDGGANINLKSLNNETPLTLAAKFEDISIIDLLLSYNVQNYRTPHTRFSHLHISCMRNNVKVVEKLLKNQGELINEAVALDSMCWAGYTPLHFAVQYGCIEVVELLLKFGADITAKEKREMTPLHLADLHRNNEIIDLILIAHKYQFRNPTNAEGLSHFHIACTRDDVLIVERFLKSGVNMNLQVESFPWKGFRPVDFAMYYECRNVVELLIRTNAVVWSKYSPYLLKLMFRMKNRIIHDLIPSKRAILFHVLEKGKSFTALDHACIQNDREELEKLLSCKQICVPSDFDIPNWSGCTPGHLAVRCKSAEAVKFLLKHGASFMVQDAEGKTPLHIAFECRQTRILHRIVRALDSSIQNLMDNTGLSIFHILCSTDRVESINNMISQGININAQVGDASMHWAGFTPLHFAAKFLQHKVVTLLLKHHPDVSIKNAINMNPVDLLIDKLDENYLNSDVEDTIFNIFMAIFSSIPRVISERDFPGMKALHGLCLNDDTECAVLHEYLISHPDEVNKTIDLPNSLNLNKCTALHLAMQRHNFDHARLLLAKGANPLIINGNGETPFECAASGLGLFWIGSVDTFLFIVSTSGEPLKPSHFHLACASGLTNFVKGFLKNVTDDKERMRLINYCNDDGQTPLQSLLMKNFNEIPRKQMVHLLLENGADVNSRDFQFRTPLHRMQRPGDHNNIRTLVSYGADVNAQDLYGYTPLYLILGSRSISNKLEILLFLLENGADINIVDQLGRTCIGNKQRFGVLWNDDLRDCSVALLKHVKKLQVIGFYVSTISLQAYANLLTDLSVFFDEAAFANECQKELELMMNINIDSSTTLHDILFKNLDKMALLCENVVLRTIVLTSEFFKKFPIYGFLIKLQLKNGEARGPLLMQSEKSLIDLSRRSLPSVCLEMICQYLSNTDLRNMILSTKEIE